MDIKTIKYERTFNLGNYENEKIAVEANVEVGENKEAVLQKLKDWTIKNKSQRSGK